MSGLPIRVREFTYYDIIRGMDVTKIMASHPANPGGSHYGVVPAGGRNFRVRRQQVVDAIAEAIAAGRDPEEVHIEGVTV